MHTCYQCNLIPIMNLACECNSQGSTKDDGSLCYEKCCNDDKSCQCKKGYNGNYCNNCDEGYFANNVTNGNEKTCSGD